MRKRPIDRAEIAERIAAHITSPSDLDDAGVELVEDLVFALCWCQETHDLAHEQMRPVVQLVDYEKAKPANQTDPVPRKPSRMDLPKSLYGTGEIVAATVGNYYGCPMVKSEGEKFYMAVSDEGQRNADVEWTEISQSLFDAFVFQFGPQP